MYSTFQVNTKVKQTESGMVLDEIVMGVQFYDGDNRMGGQVVLNGEIDNITFTTPFDEISKKAIEKAKSFIADSKEVEVK